MTNIISFKTQISPDLQKEFAETDKQIEAEASLIHDCLLGTEETNTFNRKRREKLTADFFKSLDDLCE